MKEFRIEPCICGKTPSINKQIDHSIIKYSIKCCERIANADTETKCMVIWNDIINKAKEETNNENSET